MSKTNKQLEKSVADALVASLPNAVKNSKQIPTQAKRILARLKLRSEHTMAKDTGVVMVDQATLSMEAEVTKRYIAPSISLLEEFGLISVLKGTKGVGGSKRRPTMYIVNKDKFDNKLNRLSTDEIEHLRTEKMPVFQNVIDKYLGTTPNTDVQGNSCSSQGGNTCSSQNSTSGNYNFDNKGTTPNTDVQGNSCSSQSGNMCGSQNSTSGNYNFDDKGTTPKPTEERHFRHIGTTTMCGSQNGTSGNCNINSSNTLYEYYKNNINKTTVSSNSLIANSIEEKEKSIINNNSYCKKEKEDSTSTAIEVDELKEDNDPLFFDNTGSNTTNTSKPEECLSVTEWQVTVVQDNVLVEKENNDPSFVNDTEGSTSEECAQIKFDKFKESPATTTPVKEGCQINFPLIGDDVRAGDGIEKDKFLKVLEGLVTHGKCRTSLQEELSEEPIKYFNRLHSSFSTLFNKREVFGNDNLAWSAIIYTFNAAIRSIISTHLNKILKLEEGSLTASCRNYIKLFNETTDAAERLDALKHYIYNVSKADEQYQAAALIRLWHDTVGLVITNEQSDEFKQALPDRLTFITI